MTAIEKSQPSPQHSRLQGLVDAFSDPTTRLMMLNALKTLGPMNEEQLEQIADLIRSPEYRVLDDVDKVTLLYETGMKSPLTEAVALGRELAAGRLTPEQLMAEARHTADALMLLSDGLEAIEVFYRTLSRMPALHQAAIDPGGQDSPSGGLSGQKPTAALPIQQLDQIFEHEAEHTAFVSHLERALKIDGSGQSASTRPHRLQ